MIDLINLFIKAVFVENLALTFFLGMCTFLAVSKQIGTALGLGIAVVVVQSLTIPINNLIYQFLIRDGALAWTGLSEMSLRFPWAHHLHQRHCGGRTGAGNVSRPIRPLTVQLAGDLFAADYRQLRHSRRLSVYGRT